jgi:D-sedoheptulose 7-phosphate isomerase
LTTTLKIRDYYKQYSQELIDCLNQVDLNAIEAIVMQLIKLRENNGILYLAGNGGSAAIANHFATDIGVGSFVRNSGVRCISLCANTSNITAIGNDLSFEQIYQSQFEALLPSASDFLIVFSASGNSKNIISLLSSAKKNGVASAAFTGFDGGEARRICDLSVHIETEIGRYGIVEDAHASICHAITELVRTFA